MLTIMINRTEAIEQAGDGELAAECGWDAVDWKIDHYTLEES